MEEVKAFPYSWIANFLVIKGEKGTILKRNLADTTLSND